MSQSYYNKEWKTTQQNLQSTLEKDAEVQSGAPYRDLNVAKWLMAHLFLNYTKIANSLDLLYDQIIHPQKREVLSRLLDLTLGRLLELKFEITKIEMDDFCFFDDVLIELKLTHDDLRINVPQYYWRDRKAAVEHRAALMRQVYEAVERERFREEYLKNSPDEEKEQVWEKYLAQQERIRQEKEKLERQRLMFAKDTGDHVEEAKPSKMTFRRNRRVSEIEKVDTVQDFSPAQRQELMKQGLLDAVMEKQKKAQHHDYPWEKNLEEANFAALIIQRHWRRFWRRTKEAKIKHVLMRQWGLERNEHRDMTPHRKLESLANFFRLLQEKNQADYEKALVKIKEQVTASYKSIKEEDTADEIMEWFQTYFDESGYLPDYPPAKQIVPKGDIMGVPKKLPRDLVEKLFPQRFTKKGLETSQKMTALGVALAGFRSIGGSALVFAGHWITPKEYLRCQIELQKLKAGGGATKKADNKQKQKEKEAEKKRLLAEQAEGFRLQPSNYLVGLTKADRDYRIMWKDRDESNNLEQKFIYDIIKDDKHLELSMEVRNEVDKMMALELETLKDALERDKNPKKKRKRKKPGKKKGKKQKVKPDPTGNRTLDELFVELFQNGIIKDYKTANLGDFYGERSFAAFDCRERLINKPPSPGDVLDVVFLYCILPLGSYRIHQLGPLIRSVCLLGNENSGKELLVNIVCTETASVMFDLSPENVAGKYPGKEGLKMLQHLVQKMSRALQPSVIFVGDTEKTFYKRVPKEDRRLEPKRLAAMIAKLSKEIRPEDQVLLLGTTSRPWMAQKKRLLKVYQKLIKVPEMDYGSYAWLWKTLLEGSGSVAKSFDCSGLAKVSNGYSVHHIRQAVENLQEGSFQLGRQHLFTEAEFLDELLKTKPIPQKSFEKNSKFYDGLELPKKRALKFQQLQEEREKIRKR